MHAFATWHAFWVDLVLTALSQRQWTKLAIYWLMMWLECKKTIRFSQVCYSSYHMHMQVSCGLCSLTQQCSHQQTTISFTQNMLTMRLAFINPPNQLYMWRQSGSVKPSQTTYRMNIHPSQANKSWPTMSCQVCMRIITIYDTCDHNRGTQVERSLKQPRSPNLSTNGHYYCWCQTWPMTHVEAYPVHCWWAHEHMDREHQIISSFMVWHHHYSHSTTALICRSTYAEITTQVNRSTWKLRYISSHLVLWLWFRYIQPPSKWQCHGTYFTALINTVNVPCESIKIAYTGCCLADQYQCWLYCW